MNAPVMALDDAEQLAVGLKGCNGPCTFPCPSPTCRVSAGRIESSAVRPKTIPAPHSSTSKSLQADPTMHSRPVLILILALVAMALICQTAVALPIPGKAIRPKINSASDTPVYAKPFLKGSRPAAKPQPTKTYSHCDSSQICGIRMRDGIRSSCLDVGKELIIEAKARKITPIKNRQVSPGQQCDHVVELQTIREWLKSSDDIKKLCARAKARSKEWQTAINTEDNLHFVAAPVNRLKMMFNKSDVKAPMQSKDGQKPGAAAALGVYAASVSETAANFAGI